jgi:hypothetical protein
VASQVSGGAIVACDPAMCSALLAQGVTAGNLLVLRSAASDPLGSDVVMATAAMHVPHRPERPVQQFGLLRSRVETVLVRPLHHPFILKFSHGTASTVRRHAGPAPP